MNYLNILDNQFADKPTLGSEVHEALIQEFHSAFMHENALNPLAFPALRYYIS
jgi:hypothetical protein